MSPYCITECMPARLSAVHFNILHYSIFSGNAVCISCHHTVLLCLCQQGGLLFMSPNSIRVCAPGKLSKFRVTILNYSECASRLSAVHVNSLHYSFCASKGCLHFVSLYIFTVSVPARMPADHVTILLYNVCMPANLSAFHFTTLHYSL